MNCKHENCGNQNSLYNPSFCDEHLNRGQHQDNPQNNQESWEERFYNELCCESFDEFCDTCAHNLEVKEFIKNLLLSQKAQMVKSINCIENPFSSMGDNLDNLRFEGFQRAREVIIKSINSK